LPLRVRLSLAFVAIVLVPLSVTALLIQFVLTERVEDSGHRRLGDAARSITVLLTQYEKRATAGAIDVAGLAAVQTGVRDGRDAAVKSALTLRAGVARAADVAPDFVGVVDSSGRLVTSTSRAPHLMPGHTMPPIADLAPPGATSPYAIAGRAQLQVGDEAVGTVVSGFWLDRDTLHDLQTNLDNVDVTLLVAGTPAGSTINDAEELAAIRSVAAVGRRSTAGGMLALRTAVTDDFHVVVSTRRAELFETSTPWGMLAAIVAVFVVFAALLGWLLARLTTRPLEQLSDAAMNMASGKFDTRIVVPASGEVGRLAIAFNAMSDELSSYVQALEESRDDLKRNLTRLGETLSSTHDLSKMLSVILETAIVTLRADAGALMLFTANRDELYIKIGRGLQGRIDNPTGRVRVGEGIAGRVARTGEPLHGPVGDRPGDLQLAATEPRANAVIAVALKGQGRIQGVLNLYDKEGARAFDDDDVATIRSFANQATVAIDNVLLHQEAQRLSITDGLTGLWNYRYFQMTFDKEIERASRFGRPLSVLMLDLDKFKAVNDTYGHQRGDSVLIELATRIKGAIREVDTLARYGGEEFVPDPAGDRRDRRSADGGEAVRAGRQPPLRQHRRGAAAADRLRRVAVYPDHAATPAGLVKAADTALYAAKGAGRDRVVMAKPSTGRRRHRPWTQGRACHRVGDPLRARVRGGCSLRPRGSGDLGGMPTE
jgi:GGDEF domain-containing protein/HAMP domain-containing protein